MNKWIVLRYKDASMSTAVLFDIRGGFGVRDMTFDLSYAEISDVLLENVACGVLIFARDHNSGAYHVVYANRSSEVMEHMSREEMLTMTLLDLFPYGEGQLFSEYFDDILRTGEIKKLPRATVRGVYASGWRECAFSSTDQGKVLMMYLDISQRQRAEESLSGLIEQLHALVEFLPDPAASVDPEGRIESWNQAMEKLTGISKKGAIGKKSQKMVEAFFGSSARCITEAILNEDSSVLEQQHVLSHSFEGEIINHELYVPTMYQGKGGYLAGRLAPLRSPSGSLNGAILTLRDVTQRILSGRRLQAEKEHLAVTLNSIGDGVIVVDAQGDVTMLNPLAERLTGWSNAEAQGQPVHSVFNIVNDTSRVTVDNPLDRALVEGQVITLADNTILVSRDNSERAIADSAAPIKAADGEIIGGILVFRDVTEQRLQEMRVQNSERRFRQLYNAMQQGVAVHELIVDDAGIPIDYRFLDVNPSFEDLTGLKREEILGKTVKEILPHTEDYWIQTYGQVALTGESVSFENYSQEIDRFFEVTAYCTSPGYFAVLLADITEKRKADEKLRFLSLHDQLTGLYNRHFFEQELTRIDTDKATRVGLLVCDVDGLKLVNDTFGHSTGDELLVAVSKVISDACKPEYILARIGGDEFAVLVFDAAVSELQSLGAAVRRGAEQVSSVAGTHMPLSVSIGYAVSEDTYITSGQLFKTADDNMYREKLYRSSSVRSAAVQALMKALETRDFVTDGHATRLTDLMEAFAQVLNLPEPDVTALRLLAQFHDIGKVGVPDRILFKEGPLNSAEMAEMRRHSEMGHRIAQSVPDLLPIADFILKHHEWWNGLGYPLGIQGEEIPLACRLLSIADAYDAMTSDRPYRQAISPELAIKEIESCAGIQFDPNLVDKLLPVLKEFANKT